MTLDLDLCRRIVARHRYPLLFATVSGAHLYGFPSPDSDYDLRGVHILPARDVLGLHPVHDGLVKHGAAKFSRLLLKKNRYVLEQLLSPLVVQTTPEHAELVAIAPKCLTRFHAFHYLGFAETQWKLFSKETPPRVKPLLFVYRVLLTGIHLMRAGVVEANLRHLNGEYRLPYIDDLIARKTGGAEQSILDGADLSFHAAEYARLRAQLEESHRSSGLPEASSSLAALNDLLVRLRMASID